MMASCAERFADSCSETYQERQENELMALKAIFVHELCDLREETAHGMARPPELSITLTPQQGSTGPQEVHAQIDLVVRCPQDYPDQVPDISLAKSKCLSALQVSTLEKELHALARKHRGEVMIFELAQHVQMFLHSNNKPSCKSFYEEMVKRKQQQETETRLRQKTKEEKERQAIRDEIKRRQAALLEEKRHRRELRSSRLEQTQDEPDLLLGAVERSRSCPYIGSETSARRSSYHVFNTNLTPKPMESMTSYTRRCQSTSESTSSGGSPCEHRGTQLLHFTSRGDRQVHRGKCIGHSARGSVVYAGVDLVSGDLLALASWSLPCRRAGSALADCLRQVASIEQELNYLRRLCHRNLVHYVNMKYSQDGDHVVVYMLQEFVIGTNLSFYLSEHLPLDGDMLRHCASGILSALSFLHSNNVVHRDLRYSSVFIDNDGVVRLADYSLDKRLGDLYRNLESAEKPPRPPALFDGPGGKKADVFRLGLILVSLVQGFAVTDELPELLNYLQPDVKDFINKCLIKEERQRWSVDQLLNHQFIKTPIERGPASPQKSVEDHQEQNGLKDDCEEPSDDIHLFFPANAKGHSRILTEFEVLKWLGKGAFGDVLKVRNKLDGGVYAIKRIELNPKSKQLNKKITREVKLLSRLNHENVVRYFNSWIESATTETTADLGSSVPSPISESESKLNGVEDVEQQAPPIRDGGDGVEWSVSFSGARQEESGSSEESSDDDDVPWLSYLPRTESSDSVVFARDGSQSPAESETDDSPEPERPAARIQFMYIQMEFCEKSTLRIAIDNGLCDDDERLWRLFREMVEGLVHIHQQGMIHRDLKPVNVFLDSNDHVKIGDFGLATTNILPRSASAMVPTPNPSAALEDGGSFSKELADGMTGQVGTALYLAPELDVCAGNKAFYNQKVDIYSLGIIFFEMCYHPLLTGMERVSVLVDVRRRAITLPADFNEDEMPRQAHIIRWLLGHDPSQRPTSLELLQSDLLPPPQLEESELQEMVRHTLSNPQSKAYKHLITCCFDQEVTAAEDVTFDMSATSKGGGVGVWRATQAALESAREGVTRVFRRHGATCAHAPLLLPRAAVYDATDSCVRLMTRSGGVVTAPHDLRVPFARYLAASGVTHGKRYAVERVYREKKVFGFHPRELWECAFDVVTPTPGGLMADAELLAVAWEVINEFPALRDKNCSVRLNHALLLRAILLHCGIEEAKYNDIYNILSDMRDERYTKFQVQTRLISLCLTDQAMSTLLGLLEAETPTSKAAQTFRAITKRRGDAAALAKQALAELDAIATNAEALGVKCPMVIAPSLAYNVGQYSGMMCQFVCELKKKRRRRGGLDVIAAGGRYDGMLARFRHTLEVTGMLAKEVSQAAAGISISLDKIVTALLEDDSVPNAVDVVVCSVGQRSMLREKAAVIRDLWAAGIRSWLVDTPQSLEDVQSQCRELRVPHVVVLKDVEAGTARLRTWEKDRFHERRLPVAELVDALQRVLRDDTNEPAPPAYVPVSRSETKLQATEMSNGATASNQQVMFTFVTQEKYPANTRRRLENQMDTHISATLHRLSPKVRIEVLALNIEPAVVKTLATHLELDLEAKDFQRSVALVIEKHPRHKKYLTQICDEIFEQKFEKKCPVIILYSLAGNTFKILM